MLVTAAARRTLVPRVVHADDRRDVPRAPEDVALVMVLQWVFDERAVRHERRAALAVEAHGAHRAEPDQERLYSEAPYWTR